jgi:hypothetical protein
VVVSMWIQRRQYVAGRADSWPDRGTTAQDWRQFHVFFICGCQWVGCMSCVWWGWYVVLVLLVSSGLVLPWGLLLSCARYPLRVEWHRQKRCYLVRHRGGCFFARIYRSAARGYLVCPAVPVLLLCVEGLVFRRGCVGANLDPACVCKSGRLSRYARPVLCVGARTWNVACRIVSGRRG